MSDTAKCVACGEEEGAVFTKNGMLCEHCWDDVLGEAKHQLRLELLDTSPDTT